MLLLLVFLILNFPRLILGLVEVTNLKTVEYCYEVNHTDHTDYVNIFIRQQSELCKSCYSIYKYNRNRNSRM